MSWYSLGNPPINSTYGLSAAPSTATLIAELDSTELGTKNFTPNHHQNIRVTWGPGASTTALWRLEHATSTDLATVVNRWYVWSPTGQTGQYVWNVRVTKDSRLRVVMESTAANATCVLQAEYLD